METTIKQTVKQYDVVINQTTKQIAVTIQSVPKQIAITISPLGPRGFKGKSAYEIAVENGFEGTEAEWVDSLQPNNSGNGNQVVFVQPTDPGLATPYVWFQTNESGSLVTIWINKV